ncbi:MAG: 50S ribosomal protein L11 methyltransferase [Ferruginibacter sp.]
MNYLQFDFEPHTKEESEKLIALLSELGFDGFVEEGMELVAFIPESIFDQGEFEKVLEKFAIMAYSQTTIENINWNKKWEEEYEPVLVGNFVGVRADFHKPLRNVKYEIVITPKMSFGTGHHATTSMVMQLMKDLDFKNKNVLDFGTGTGVLAILAEKLGAVAILAIDNDEWSITNALENCLQNGCGNITVQGADAIPADTGEFDVILANITLNIILDNLSSINQACRQGGKVLLSGFLKSDENAITTALAGAGFTKKLVLSQKEWIAVLCEK